jgi:DNA-binding NtrC family response regulator
VNEQTKTILIVDDENSVRQSFVDYFEDKQWQTLQSRSGEDALKIMEKETFHAAIVDIRLEGMDGNEFIRKANVINSKIAFVICTGSPEYETPEDISNLHCVSNQVFKKPVKEINTLEQEVIRLVDKIAAS